MTENMENSQESQAFKDAQNLHIIKKTSKGWDIDPENMRKAGIINVSAEEMSGGSGY